MNTYNTISQGIDYMSQNNSNTGYNEFLLANELFNVQRQRAYSLQYDDDFSQEEIDEMNESERFAVD
ncbi:hypothetical protein [Flavobacterium reichenbachii]|uniref:Uncharacterized protein n=1 Tax=Flavobacterium reichenbachii TaxID=362418 RepID=A0A085ZF07_9FLAO|nr:hypothetical protein [Flavobacterium reichenbachii]KFF03021.1 hypothetical protein IW19_23080 [Flavobacterium reichenbachii]OXB17167.1 hypothetical protein B0A68_05050 [Flavobacterium reichenbachii]